MKSKEEIENILIDLGNRWPNDSSLTDRVMREIQSSRARPKSSSPRRIIMKSIIGIAVSIAIIAAIWWGVIDNHNSLYAQVMDAVHKARTVHFIYYVQPKSGTEPRNSVEKWFASDVGFRDELSRDIVDIGNNEAIWSYNKKLNIAIRYKSHGINKTTARIFQNIDQVAQRLQDEYERYPACDKEIDGMPCKAYRWSNPQNVVGKYKSDLTSGKKQELLYIDQQSRPIRSENQTKENDQWKTKSFVCIKYNEPLDPTLFQPNFDKNVKIIDADKIFDEFVDLKKAIYTEQHDGLIFAIHRIERFENGGVMYVSSVRGTEETLKKYPIAIHTGQDLFQRIGPAIQGSSHSSIDGLHKILAWMNYQGIDIGWWAIIPHTTKPNYLEVAPNKIKLNVNIFPYLKFRKSLTEKQLNAIESGWDIVVDSPQPAAISTVEEIAKSVYDDLANLHGIRLRNLVFFDDDHHEEKNTNFTHISPNEYVKNIVRDIKWEYEHAVNSQIDEQFEQK